MLLRKLLLCLFSFFKLCILATFHCSALGRAQFARFESAPVGCPNSPLSVHGDPFCGGWKQN